MDYEEEDREPIVNKELGRPLYPWERAKLRAANTLRGAAGAMLFEPKEAPRQPSRLSEDVKARQRAKYIREGFTPEQAEEMAETYCKGG